MCTLIIAHRHFEESPIFLASNRDEALGRASSPPTVREVAGTSILAPTDDVAGGTWLGVNEWGVVVAITNRFGVAPDPGRFSRGLLVREALLERYAQVAADGIAALDARDYNPFHLVIMDRDYAEIVWGDGRQMRRVVLDPGLSVVTERSFEAATNERAERLRRRIDALRADDDLTRGALAKLLLDRRDEDIDAVTVSISEMDYGTRSSTIIELGRDPRFEFADGPPDRVPYRDYSSDLHQLLS